MYIERADSCRLIEPRLRDFLCKSRRMLSISQTSIAFRKEDCGLILVSNRSVWFLQGHPTFEDDRDPVHENIFNQVVGRRETRSISIRD